MTTNWFKLVTHDPILLICLTVSVVGSPDQCYQTWVSIIQKFAEKYHWVEIFSEISKCQLFDFAISPKFTYYIKVGNTTDDGKS